MNSQTNKAARLLISCCALLLAGASLSGCGEFLGKKTSLDFLGNPDYSLRAVEYVTLQPEIRGFVNPVHVAPGFDQLLYVVDSFYNVGSSRCAIYAYDQAGNRVGSFFPPDSVLINHVEQDRSLDLIATGKVFRTVPGNRRVGFPAIFRIGQLEKEGTGLGLQFANIKRTMIYPFFIREQLTRLNYVDSAYLMGINLRDLAILPGNRYYVTCESKFATPPIFSNYPNNSILLCQSPDTNWIALNAACAGPDQAAGYFQRPFGIASFVNPPQTLVLSDPRDDFFWTTIDENTVIKVQYIEVTPAAEGPASYCLRPLTTGDTSKALGFMNTPFRFKAPRAVAMAGDGSRAVFVIDGDSLYQFTTDGLEGTQPPAGSRSSRVVNVSFGGTGNGPRQFRRPTSVAYLRQVVYVADAGNQRIMRFRLTTNFQ